MIHRLKARMQNRRSRWHGYVEGIAKGRIQLWVCSKEQPHLPVGVEISLCGEQIACLPADQERRDVAAFLGRKIATGCSLALGSLAEPLRETLSRKLQALAGESVLLPAILSVRIAESGDLLPFTGAAASEPVPLRELLLALGDGEGTRPASDLETLRTSPWFDAPWYAAHHPDVGDLGMDPAEHYLRLGAMLGRNPSAAFDAEAYLKRYPRVATRGLNPLVHFEKWGRENGYRPFPPGLNGANAAPDSAPGGEVDVLLSCWLGRPEPLHDGFAAITRALNSAGLTVQILCPPGPVAGLLRGQGCGSVIPETYSVIASPHLLGSPGRLPPLAPQIARQIISRDMEFFPSRSFTPAQHRKLAEKCGRFYNFWRSYLLTHQVKFFLIWGNTAPTSRLFIQLCQELGVEYMILERGHFPGTFHADLLGQFAYGASLRWPEKLLGSDAAAPDPERLRDIEAWGAGRLAVAADMSDDSPAIRRILAAKASGKRILLMLGANDPGSGLLSPELGMARLSWFGSSERLFGLTARILQEKFSDTILVARPHPSQRFEAAEENTILAPEEPLERLIALADICMPISSSTYALCLLAHKPLLHFGAMDQLFSPIGRQIRDQTEILPALREILWSGCAPNYQASARAKHLADLFHDKLIACAPDLPARFDAADLGEAIAARIGLGDFGSQRRFRADPPRISKALYDDISTRSRMAFTPATAVPPRRFSLVIPVYSDLPGSSRAFDLVAKYKARNDNHRVILVWDQGPDLRLLDLCRNAVAQHGFVLLENRANTGFSGSVNRGIEAAGRDDVILLNSDTVVCDDWALRLRAAACAHPKLAAVVPFSNNATIFNLPFPEGRKLPDPAFSWVRNFDLAARTTPPCVMEMPVAHGFCTYIRREAFDRVGLFDEMAFGIGQGEDNDFSLRLRGAGYFLGCATNVFVGHDGGTSFGEEAMAWKRSGRSVMAEKYPHYMEEIRAFLAEDPLAELRNQIMAAAEHLPGAEC